MSNTNYVYLVEVRFDSALALWTIEYHVTNMQTRQLVPKTFRTEMMARRFARKYCRNLAKLQGSNLRLELQFYNKNGQIESGPGGKESYGSDPRAVKG